MSLGGRTGKVCSLVNSQAPIIKNIIRNILNQLQYEESIFFLEFSNALHAMNERF
jgi:Ni,Fe-hydrogenase I small subunit